MPINIFNLPVLQKVVALARGSLRAALPGANPWLNPNNANPMATFVAGVQYTAYQRLDFVGRQSFAQFAEDKYLDDHAAELGLARKQATGAIGNIVVTPASGSVGVATGAVFRRGDGALFSATATVGASSGPVSVPVVGPAGAASNTEPGAPMDIVSGVTTAPGAVAAVDGAGLAGGADIEPDGAPQSRDLSTLRGRILFRKANPAQGGAPSDYVGWALAVANVTRVYVERRWNGPGTVRVFPLMDDLFASAGGIPNSGFIAIVNAALQPLAPAGCALTVAAPTPFPIDVPIVGLNPNSSAAQAAVAAELADAFRRLGRVSGADSAFPGMDYLASPLTFPALWIEQAVANASGVVSADVGATDQVVPAGAMPVVGDVSYA